MNGDSFRCPSGRKPAAKKVTGSGAREQDGSRTGEQTGSGTGERTGREPETGHRPGPRVGAGEKRRAALIREIDLGEPMPAIEGGRGIGQAWLLLRFGDVAVGDLATRVPENGLTSAEVGAAVAARYGTAWRRTVTSDGPAQRDRQPRSRNRGRMSSE
jgi:hypothetical protein